MVVGKKALGRCIPIFMALVVFCVFSMGVNGGFLLDDYAVLPTLYENMDLNSFWFGVLEGQSGPLGRPISLLTFALQYDSWPDPYAFKIVNIIIHMLNALLIYSLTRNLLKTNRAFLSNKKSILFSAIVALLWACTPIQISSVLYVVQRMTTLSAFFVLCGLNLYAYSRINLAYSRGSKHHLIMMTLSVLIFGMLAIFSKESGFLLVFYVLSIELLMPVFERNKDIKRSFGLWKIFFIFLPITLFIGYVCFKLNMSLIEKYESGRNFSLLERLLTESRIIMNYLQQIILPKVSQLGVFHDDIVVSKGLFDPVTTFFSVMAICVSIIAAYIMRGRWHVFSFVIFWFFSGHILESTVFPLELYFEHRNYLALYSIFFAGVYIVVISIRRFKDIKLPLAVFLALFFSGHLFLTASQIYSWGSELEFAFQQAEYHPNSIRARSLKVEMLAKYSEISPELRDLAYEEAKKIQKEFSERISTSLFDIEFACAYGDKFELLSLDYIRNRIKIGLYEPAVIKMTADLTTNLIEGKCKSEEITMDYAKGIIAALIASKKYASKRHTLHTYMSMLYLQEGNISMAIHSLLDVENKTYDIHMQLARLLAITSNFQGALMQLDKAEEKRSFADFNSAHRNRSLIELRRTIEQDAEGSKVNGK